MWERAFCLPGLLLQCEPHTDLFPPCTGGRGGNCRQEAKTSLHSLLTWEEPLPRTHLLSFLTPIYMCQGKGEKKENLIIESVSWNLLFLGIWEVLSPDFHFRLHHFCLQVSKDYTQYWRSSLPEMKWLLTVTYFSSSKTVSALYYSQNSILVETSL